VIATVALVVAIGGTAIAAVGAIPADGRFTACYQTSDNVLNRIVLLAEPGEQGPNSYGRVTWPAQASGGAQGPAGPHGPAGPPGPAGPQGLPGKGTGSSGLVASVSMREVTSTGGTVIVRCGGIGKRRYAVGGGGAIVSGGSYRIAASYPVGDDQRRPNGWAVVVGGQRRYTIVTPGRQTTSKTIGGAFAGPHTHQFDPGPRLMPLDGVGKPAVVRVFAICARVG
jgi:hypothetical protein